MYNLILYQLPKSERWRWKFSFNNRILARAEYHYASRAAAHKSFARFAKAAHSENYVVT